MFSEQRNKIKKVNKLASQDDCSNSEHVQNSLNNSDKIDKMEGNISILSSFSSDSNCSSSPSVTDRGKAQTGYRNKNARIANSLPFVTVCNMRSFSHKLENYKNDGF